MIETDKTDEYAAIADLYDLVTPYAHRPDVPFFVEAARECGGNVLELGCGTGRVLIPIARAGFYITGLDLSHGMLETCRKRLAVEPAEVRERVTLVEVDMRAFEIPGSFQLATLPFRPFQHLLTVEDQLACLGCIHRHLAEGGRVIIDLFNPKVEALAENRFGEVLMVEPEFTTPDGRKVVRKHTIASRDMLNQVNHVELIYEITHPDGRVERLVQAFPMRWFYKFEMEHLLARACFQVEQVYADYEKHPYGSIYPGELIFVARKQAD